MHGTIHKASLIARQAVHYLPSGRTLPDEIWRVRHRTLTAFLLAHIPGVIVFGLTQGVSVNHVLLEAGAVAFFGALGLRSWARRELAAASTAIGLVTSSAVLVHLASGTIEVHFHFFVVVSALALYQDWVPFGVAVVYVGLHHGVFGVAAPHLVYNHPDAIAHPVRWALVHSGFVLAAAAASIVAWRLNEEEALKDALTKLPNRRLFHDRLEQAFARARRSQTMLAVLNVDLDGFKAVNDTHGHAVGDEVLAGVALRLRRAIRTTDTAARLGGDEFAVILEDVGNSAEIGVVAERILASVSAPFELGEVSARVGASIGIATTLSATTTTELLVTADRSMYAIKRTGGGAVARTGAGIDADRRADGRSDASAAAGMRRRSDGKR